MQRQDFWSRFHRFFHFHPNRYGIWFDHKGDEILWKYPWYDAKNKKRFYSLGFESNFYSIEDIDNFWNEYFEACKKIKS